MHTNQSANRVLLSRFECADLSLLVCREACWQYFCSKCIDNLHVVLSMSPSGDVLRTRCRNFPGLVNNTCIDWLFPWPLQALVAVASVFLAEVRSALALAACNLLLT